jgi:hypothetical protein
MKKAVSTKSWRLVWRVTTQIEAAHKKTTAPVNIEAPSMKYWAMPIRAA